MAKKLINTSFDQFYKTNEFVAKTTPMKTHYFSKNSFERYIWNQKILTVKAMLEEIDIKNVVDIGCGDGILSEIVRSDIKYTGIDISPTQIENAKRNMKNRSKKNTDFIIGDVIQSPFKDQEFEAGMVCDVMEHVIDFNNFIQELKRIIKNKGYLIISIPNEPLLQLARLATFRFPLRSPDHLYSISPNDIKKNFKIIKVKNIPFGFSSSISLIRIFLVQNVKE